VGDKFRGKKRYSVTSSAIPLNLFEDSGSDDKKRYSLTNAIPLNLFEDNGSGEKNDS